jgi:PPOX class probable F420-dependent enzyme
MKIDGEAERILRGKTFAHLALIDSKGRPHVSPLWIDVDDDGRAVINTAEGRVKAKALQVGTEVALSACDEDDPYRYVSVRGRVVARTHEGADDVIHALSRKYRGKNYSIPAEQQRVTVLIEADHIYIRG